MYCQIYYVYKKRWILLEYQLNLNKFYAATFLTSPVEKSEARQYLQLA